MLRLGRRTPRPASRTKSSPEDRHPALLPENNQFIGRDKYEKMLRSNGVLPERFEGEMRKTCSRGAGLVKASVVVPDAEMPRVRRAQRQATISTSSFPRRVGVNAQPSDA
jgi:hypothetical protein